MAMAVNRDQETAAFEAGRAAGREFGEKCANFKVVQVVGDVFGSTVLTGIALFRAVFSALVFNEERRIKMENRAFGEFSRAADIFYRIFERNIDSVGVVVPHVKAKLDSWLWQALESWNPVMQKVGSRGVFAMSIIALAVAHVADAIIGVTAGLLSLGTGRCFDSLNQVADKAFCGWTGIVRDTVFCALRVLRVSGVNPLVNGQGKYY